MTALTEAIQRAAKDLFQVDLEPKLERPAEQFGDYSTNAAMLLANQAGKSPVEISKALADKLSGLDFVAKAETAGPGFINIRLTDTALLEQMIAKPDQPLKGQEILVEFGDPNPFKEMHIGHLYSYVVGESLCRLLEASGAKVERLSYHGDVGRHVARALWGMKHGAGQSMGELYAAGAQADENNQAAKAEIDRLNELIYSGKDNSINQLYEKGRTQSFKEFDKILNMLSIKTDKRYLESDSAEQGIEMVKANLGLVFEESEGAIVYKGEQDGLHTRVFLTSKGLPTYETKDLGLARLKAEDYPRAERSIIITAHEQAEYFKVMLAALAKIDKPVADQTTHLYHGFVNLSTGKMSSRKGEVFTAQKLLDDVADEAGKVFDKATAELEIGAVKYGFLKHRLGGDILYDPAESVSLQGDSGPYLQYAHARARSILKKAQPADTNDIILEPLERSLTLKISQFAEVVEQAAAELLPNHICTYLYELAQVFNRFYESSRVIDDPRQALRLKLVEAYTDKLRQGLALLNIAAPDKL